jgi:dihydrofolate reductase
LALLPASDHAFVIGGAELYAAMLPWADELLLTEIDHDFDGDAFFPSWDAGAFVETRRDTHRASASHPFDFAFVSRCRRG